MIIDSTEKHLRSQQPTSHGTSPVTLPSPPPTRGGTKRRRARNRSR